MRALLTPGLALIRSCSLGFSFAIAGILVSVPLLLALFVLYPVFSNAAGAPSSGTAVVLALAAVFVVLGLYVLACLYSWTRTGLVRLGQTLERIASGDLTSRIDADDAEASQESEAGRLWDSAKQMNASLVEIVNQVRASSDTIVSGAKEIAAGNTNLSQRTEEQAASLEETASGIDELSATIEQNAANCNRASELVKGTRDVTTRASDRMHRLSTTMTEIDSSAKRVTEIVGLIEGIAFQTNILALNAAIEAARAGQQGRGFSVVATEVRSLAQRCAGAANDIKALVSESVDKAGQGSRLVLETGAAMDQLVKGVGEVQALVDQIATASAEQSSGVEEINKAVVKLDAVTQQNAALVEEAAAAASSFEEEAGRLVDVVGTFKVDRMEEQDEAVALVKKAANRIRQVGVQQACKDINSPQGGFKFGDLYAYVIDKRGIRLAHASEPQKCGEDSSVLKDADGKEFIREMIHIANTRARRWCDYKWANPSTKQVEQKSAYVALVDDVIVGCGIYKGEVAAPLLLRDKSKRGKPLLSSNRVL